MYGSTFKSKQNLFNSGETKQKFKLEKDVLIL